MAGKASVTTFACSGPGPKVPIDRIDGYSARLRMLVVKL
jgi:hypothetical protein